MNYSMSSMMRLMKELKIKHFLIHSRNLALASSHSLLKRDMPELKFTTSRSRIRSSQDITDFSLNNH